MVQNVISILLIVFQFGIHFRHSILKILTEENNNLNTAAGANYLNSFEKELVLEMNKLRTDPAGYAEKYIAPLSKKL